MLDKYVDRSNKSFKNGEYRVVDKFCFDEFLLLIISSHRQLKTKVIVRK